GRWQEHVPDRATAPGVPDVDADAEQEEAISDHRQGYAGISRLPHVRLLECRRVKRPWHCFTCMRYAVTHRLRYGRVNRGRIVGRRHIRGLRVMIGLVLAAVFRLTCSARAVL